MDWFLWEGVVFVDGIPIESTLLDAGESGLKGEEKSDPTSLAALDPRALFDKYDTDGSGDIDLEEFKVLLHDLNVKLTEPKARAYFKRCDRRRRGCISFDEFRLALYTCDPKNPERTGGFAPGQSLSPKDLFEMFDKDEAGAFDRGAFMELLEFIGHKMPLDKMEALFATYEDPELEMMPYVQFKKAWLSIVDVHAELRLRGEKFNRFLPPRMLTKKLAMLVNLEEKQEAMTLLEANNTISDEIIAAQRRGLAKEARLLAHVTLAEALDAAGQVYVFGKGAYQRFDSEPKEPDFVDFMEYGIVRELWQQRICPSIGTSTNATASSKSDEKNSSGSKATRTQSASRSAGMKRTNSGDKDSSSNSGDGDTRLSPSRTKLETSAHAFANRQVSRTTAFLWGKRVNQVACGAAVAYALTDAGEVFCWGGNKRQWRYFYDEVTAANGFTPSIPSAPVEEGGNDPSNANTPAGGDVLADLAKLGPRRDSGLLQNTPRSEMLRLFALPSQVTDSHEIHDKLGLRQKYAKIFDKPLALALTDEDRRRRLQLVGQYYGLLDSVAPPVPGKPFVQRTLDVLMETVEPDLDVDELSLSLYMRGVELAKPTRTALLETLGECLELEIECVGDKFHNYMKQQDQIARRYRKERRERPMVSIVLKTNAMWFELGELRGKMVNAERERLINGGEEYDNMKRKITHATQKLKRRAREGHSAIVVADNNNNSDSNKTDHGHGRSEEEALLYINGLTARGPALRFFNGSQALQSIAVGSRHALAIHSSGKLYTWGVGSFGRLGGAQNPATVDDPKESGEDRSNNEDVPVDAWHRDAHTAQVIPSVRHLRFRAISCGFGHSLALSTDGTVYAWGSATHGKLGIGPVQVKESFTIAPMVISSLTSLGIRVRKIACGPSHSALLTVDGALFVWGCGDGGRLGLGDGRDVGEDQIPRNGGQLSVVPTPTHVAAPFGQEKLVGVACGAAHTVVVSALQRSSSGQLCGGGCVYVAGSNHALDKFSPQFTLVVIEDASSAVMVTKVSCGPAHTALVSTEGEVYTWGKNVGGSTGHAVSIPLISQPTRVGCMFERPRNLCLDKAATATQSSQNASAIAEYALSGDHAAREMKKRQQNRRASGRDRVQQSTAAKFAQTQQELCPFWHVALAERCRIVSIRIVLVSSSISDTDSTTARSTLSTKQTRYAASAGGPKYAIMVSEDAFDPELRGKQSLAKARGQSVHISLSGANQSELTWVVPADTFGSFIRVQLESTSGAAMLGLERVEVLGASSEQYVGPRVSEVVCAEGMTVAICTPLSAKEELRDKFRRAARADRASVDVLAQLETFHPFVREEVQQAQAEEALYRASQTAKTSIEKRDVATAIAALEAQLRAEPCVLCRPKLPCVICQVEKQVRAAKQKLSAAPTTQPPIVPQQLQQPKKSMNDRRKRPGRPLAPQVPVTPAAKRTGVALTLEALCAEFLTLDTRSKEEEEEAQRRLELELMDPDALARAKQEEEAAARQARGQVAAGPAVLHSLPNMRQLLVKLLTTSGLLGHKRPEQSQLNQ
ncbi:hypothetical protein PHYPSEUDO_014680 [Phytophthora pseudosyringae]|uniref:EF-hand domain-containing protein n=1 Tax=Phytophthora pseudosyringae TaxID=221518 RepID=A0A8T1W4S3_9STRA|nr:hypothetical protein PHYPSEUDO_014680 [Phytophthora pseudosyringae]